MVNLINLYDHNLFKRLPDETRRCLLRNKPILEVLVEAVSLNYTCGNGYLDYGEEDELGTTSLVHVLPFSEIVQDAMLFCDVRNF